MDTERRFHYFVGAAWQKDGSSGGFNKRDVRMLTDLNMAGRVTLVDGDNKELFPGIKVYTGSGHTSIHNLCWWKPG